MRLSRRIMKLPVRRGKLIQARTAMQEFVAGATSPLTAEPPAHRRMRGESSGKPAAPGGWTDPGWSDKGAPSADGIDCVSQHHDGKHDPVPGFARVAVESILD